MLDPLLKFNPRFNIKYYLFFGLVFLRSLLFAQSLGFESRTNDNSYFSFFTKDLSQGIEPVWMRTDLHID